MIEMSAATLPALAQPGAILAAAPTTASSEGAQSADFSAVLAGAALVAQMPEPTVAPEPTPPTLEPIVPELVATVAKFTGKCGPSGKETGKMLPPGKPPVTRNIAVSTKAQGAPLAEEAPDKPAPSQDATPVEQTTVDAPAPIARNEQVMVDTPVQSAPAAPTPIVIQQTATVLQERTIAHDALQATAEPAPARPANLVTRQTASSRSTATAIPMAEQPIVAAAPLTTPTIVANILPNAAVKPATMSSDPVAASLHGMPKAASRDVPAGASREAVAPTLRNAVLSSATPVPSQVVAPDGTGIDGTGIDRFGPAARSAVIPQTVEVAPTPSATVTTSVATPGPLVSTKATLVTSIATNLMQLDTVQPSALSVRTDGLSATALAADVAHPALASAAAASDLALPATPTLPAGPMVASAPAASAPEITTAPMPVAPGETDAALQPATLAIAPTLPAVPSMATANLQAGSSAIIAPVLPAKGETVRLQASDDLTIPVPLPSMPTADQGKPAIRVEAALTSTVVQSTRDATASLSAQPLSQAPTTSLAAVPTAATLATVLPVPAPDVAIQQAATIAPALSQPRIEAAMVAQPALAGAEPAEHKRALPIAATEAPATVSRTEPVSIVTGNDMRTAAIFAAPLAPAAATTPTQDIAALVDRITEARAAAAPNTIRAALVHEDFGSVSLNFRSEASHIHVTLGSADPGFAPAVQAAAAANLANNGSDDAQHRRDAPAPQTNPQQQDAARNDASSQQQQAQRDRTNAGERQPSRQTPGRQPATTGERASSAAEPRRRSGIFA